MEDAGRRARLQSALANLARIQYNRNDIMVHSGGFAVHEMGVVFHVISRLEDLAKEQELTEISSVTLRIGEVSGILNDMLADCFSWAVKKTEVLKNATLTIEEIPALTYCEDCGELYPTVANGKICPHCGSEHTYLYQGNEFEIKEIEAC